MACARRAPDIGIIWWRGDGQTKRDLGRGTPSVWYSLHVDPIGSTDKYWVDKAKYEIELYGSKLKQRYGFLADPSKTLLGNVEDYYGSMDVCTCLIGRPTNMACHNLCSKNKALKEIEFLLGLGAKYCVQRMKLDPCQLDWQDYGIM